MHWISNSKTNAIAYASYYGAFSKTTYLPTSATTVSSSIGSATAACSGVGYANTVPTAIASAAASTGTALVSTSPAYVLQPTLLYGATAVQALATATFSDGRFIIAYRVTGTYVTYASIFTAAGTLIQTITVATSTNASYGVSVAVLTSGKFVVSYINSGGNGSNALYSSSYTLIATTTFSVYTGANYNINVAGLSNDRFVVSYNNGQQYYAVYDSSNTLIAGPTSVLGANCYQNGVCANNWGGFYITFYYPGSGSTYIYSFVNTTGTTYTNYNNYSFGTSMYMCNARPVFSNGWVYSPVGYSGSTTPMIQISDDIATTGNYSSSMSGLDTQSYANMAIGVTGLGNPVVFYPSSGSPNTALFAYTNRTPNNWSSPIVFPNSGKFSMSGATFRGNTGYGSIPSVTSGVGNNVVVAWCNTDGYLYYAIVNMAPYSATLSTVAGVTSSAQIPVSPTAATSSTAIGATFVGVAAATVAAGSAGPVVTNGPAKLNASYTNTASGAFDHSGTPTGGVRGTYSGKIINMQGNT